MEPSITQISALPLTLDLVSGPELAAVTLSPERTSTIGRSSTCEVQLPDKAVSRSHAQLRARPGTGGWQIVDLGSKHGTYLNGVRLAANEVTPVRGGDLLSIDPWTFRARLGTARAGNFAATTDSVLPTQKVTTLQVADLASLAQQRLALLIDSSAMAQNASDERELAETVLRAALQGTGFSRAAIVRASQASDRVEVVAALPESPAAPGGSGGSGGRAGTFAFSRTLIREAGKGEIVTLSQEGGSHADVAVSIVSLSIESAVCAPIYLGNAIDACLYLDAREGERQVHSQSAAFCKALARMYGTALGNLKRLEVERTRGQLKAELEAAGVAQSFIMPAPSGRIGRVRYAFRSRPGRFASGDLFDAVEMPGGRVGVFLGDVSGKGAAAAIVMAVAQTHLRGVLSAGASAAEAIASLNSYIASRNREGQFITLWLAVLDPGAGRAEYVDAGHGYWMLRRAGESPVHPSGESHLVVGVDPEYPYTPETVELSVGTRLLVCSDGVIEQCSPGGEQFGRDRALETVSACADSDAEVSALVEAVLSYAATDALSDDVTAASVECLHAG